MKQIKRHLHVIIVMLGLMTTISSCEDLAFGNKFLQKPPSSDVTIDTVFSTAEYARRVLWYSYQNFPYGMSTSGYWTSLYLATLEALTDLNQSSILYSGANKRYYSGDYNAGWENPRGPLNTWATTKLRFYDNESHMWSSIRNAWIMVENVDRVPDMDYEEKERLKAEAKTVVAVYYAHMLRHYGALPIVDKVIPADEANLPGRATLEQTVNFIVRILDEAIVCPYFPWSLPEDEFANWNGRVTKASAMGLKTRVLLFAASPLFNSDEPYYPGEASDKLMTWYGNYDRERWKKAVDACDAFFKAMAQNGYYKLVEKEDVAENEYRYAFRKAYFDRGTTETLISSRRASIFVANNNGLIDQALRWGGYNPTKEYFDMFQTADGDDFDWNNPEHSANPFINRDPRLNETFVLDGDIYQGRTVAVTEEHPDEALKDDYPAGRDWGQGKMDARGLRTGIGCRKWGLDRGGEYNNHVIQWPYLRIAEVYLNYAEALNEYNGGPNELAYEYVNKVRARVGMKGLKRGLTKEQFREALLRERACEFGYEEVRFFDLIRWKRSDIFTKPLHGFHIYKNKNDGSYLFDEFPLSEIGQTRAWWESGFFSNKWFLSAFPSEEVNKGYGLVQNPGWE